MAVVVNEKKESPYLLSSLANIQKAAFPNSFSSKLGTLYLKKNISWYLNNPACDLVTLSVEKSIVGFMGTYERKNGNEPGSTNQILRFSIKEAVLCALAHPSLFLRKQYFLKSLYFWKFLKSRLLKKNNGLITTQPDFKPYLGLVVIAVHPKHQKKGYGKILLEEFNAIAQIKGYQLAKLTVDKDNLSANLAYQKAGWIKETETSNSISYVKPFSYD